MNQLHFLAFFIFASSALTAGVRIYSFINKQRAPLLNRSIYLGESFLLGSSWVIGLMMILGFAHLYRPAPLWGVVLANFLFLLDKNVREAFRKIIFSKVKVDLPLVILLIFTAFFIFRNCYYLIDIDSIMGYAFTHRFWLEAGTNLVGTDADYWPTFLPQYDSVPYALGIALFGNDMLFGGLISLYWRLIAVLLVFGYTSYRFDRWYGLAAVFLMLLDDHMFYSGLNAWVIINSALVALGFAAAYNLWEARAKDSVFRLVLGIIFLSQMIANKYQSFWIVLFLSGLAILFQSNILDKVKFILRERRYWLAVLIAVAFGVTWYIKNIIMTGTPLFFKFAGVMHSLGWTPEHEKVMLTVLGGLSFSKAIKYLSFNFVWAGVYSLKYLWMVICFLPLFLIAVLKREKLNREALLEFLFWTGLSVLAVLGTSLAAHYEPRYYRFSIGIFVFAAVFSLHYVISECFNIKNKIVIIGIIGLLSIPGYKVAFEQGGPFKRPTFGENFNVLTNKMNMNSVIEKYYPGAFQIQELLNKNPDKVNSLAYYIQDDMKFPLMFIPIKPIVCVWRSSLVKWDSYNSEELIVKDLQEHNVQWVVVERPVQQDYIIQPVTEFAKILTNVERYPKLGFYDYGFPKEFVEMKY